MKRTIILVIVMVFCLAFTNTAETKEFSKVSLATILTTPENSKIKFKDILKKHKGKVTVIEIWASWCSDCVKAMPKIKELETNNPNVDYVFISLDKTSEKWTAALEKYDLKGDHYWANDPKMMKGEFGKSIDLDWIPRYIILDKKGKIAIYRAIETDFDKINETLKNLQ